MTLTNSILIGLIFITSYVSALYCYNQKRWIGLGLSLAFLVRIHVAWILSGGLQYSFVLDSLEYEMKAWYLIQPWMNESLRVSFNPGHINNYNPYDYLLAGIYLVFGKDTLIAPLVNCSLATLTIYLLYRIQADFTLRELPVANRCGAMLCTLAVVAVYPSYIIWSATNIRDPLYLLSCVSFIYFGMRACSGVTPQTVLGRGISLVLSALALALVLGLRGYLGGVLIGAVGGGLVFYGLVRVVGTTWAAVGGSVALVGALFLTSLSFADDLYQGLAALTALRRTFSNFGFADIYARSSFGLDQTFQSPADVLLFLPNALAHYFFGPFLWEISDWVQGVSFLETLFVLILVVPTWAGIRHAYRRAPLVTTILLAFVVTFSCAQALVISNMGTIFRHRTLCLLLLFLFTGEGVYGFYQKNRSALLTT